MEHNFLTHLSCKYPILDSSGTVGEVRISRKSELQDHYHQKYTSLFIIWWGTVMTNFFFHSVLFQVSPTIINLLCVLWNSSGVAEAPASGRGEGPPCVRSHFSVCLIIALCLYWHRPVCFFLPHCESGFICAMPGTNYFNEMNVNWRAKHSLVFCLAENTCCITKHRLCITRSLQENSGDKETTGYPNQTCTCTKWDSVPEHEGSLSQEIDAGVKSDLDFRILES